ncbi:isocitrate dehydrogenase [NAD] regulatory subunit B, mitochondrial (plasmid) [Arthrobacter sp. Hiyo8]|nr:isocitrate dehydrogenase [NAD] regulatory subunit B, mitochondrial [Arthrobacter sp. Hiyo8]GAP60764.1 isocitrate dehydrogenase [NAD] regulatory subunit B, mitochondrial [Arthrobacter sp. Hiyo1]
MMLEHLGHADAARHLQEAFEAVLRDGVRTRDIGGTASTTEFTSAVLSMIDALDSADLARASQ